MLKYQVYPGLKIEYLTFIEKVSRKWKVKCDCGKIWEIRADTIFRDGQKSCGCKTNYKNGNNSHRWKGYGDIKKSLFDEIKTKAKQRNYIFEITIEDIWNQYLKQNGKCYLSGLPIKFYQQVKLRKKETASLDRIDSKKGYTKDNIQIVHKHINLMKKELSNIEFINICKTLVF